MPSRATRERKVFLPQVALLGIVAQELEIPSSLVQNDHFPSTGETKGGSIKQRIHHAHLNAPDIASLAVLGFFLSVKSLQTDAQAFAKLPHQVKTCVMGAVIGIRPLGCLVVEVHVAVGRG